MQLATKCSRWLNTYIIVRAAIWSAPSCCGTSVVLCAHPITPSLGACRWELSHLRNGVPNSLLLRANNRHKSGLLLDALLVKTLALNTWNVMGVFQLKQKPGITELLSSWWNNHHCWWLSIYMTLAEMFTDDGLELCSRYVHVMFTGVLSHSLTLLQKLQGQATQWNTSLPWIKI